jgi:hypothetical protein
MAADEARLYAGETLGEEAGDRGGSGARRGADRETFQQEGYQMPDAFAGMDTSPPNALGGTCRGPNGGGRLAAMLGAPTPCLRCARLSVHSLAPT